MDLLHRSVHTGLLECSGSKYTSNKLTGPVPAKLHLEKFCYCLIVLIQLGSSITMSKFHEPETCTDNSNVYQLIVSVQHPNLHAKGLNTDLIQVSTLWICLNLHELQTMYRPPGIACAVCMFNMHLHVHCDRY